MNIKLNDCSVKIKNNIILQNINFEVKEGIFYNIFGENGTGKSIFLHALLGLTPFSSGAYTIEYNKADLCYITSIPFYFDNEKVKEVVKLLSGLYNVDIATLCGIMKHLALDYYTISGKKMAELSQGMRQKIMVLPMFLKEPQLFILDEIFVGFDQKTQENILDRLGDLAKQHKTVLIVEHNAHLIKALQESIKMERYVCKEQKILPVLLA